MSGVCQERRRVANKAGNRLDTDKGDVETYADGERAVERFRSVIV
jgi:hypothetical protein